MSKHIYLVKAFIPGEGWKIVGHYKAYETQAAKAAYRQAFETYGFANMQIKALQPAK
jgi:hypothetical protein